MMSCMMNMKGGVFGFFIVATVLMTPFTSLYAAIESHINGKVIGGTVDLSPGEKSPWYECTLSSKESVHELIYTTTIVKEYYCCNVKVKIPNLRRLRLEYEIPSSAWGDVVVTLSDPDLSSSLTASGASSDAWPNWGTWSLDSGKTCEDPFPCTDKSSYGDAFWIRFKYKTDGPASCDFRFRFVYPSVPIGKVQNVRAVYNDSTGKMTLTWDPLADTTYYRIRYSRDGGTWTLLENEWKNTLLTHENIVLDSTYKYEIIPFNAEGRGESVSYSDPVMALADVVGDYSIAYSLGADGRMGEHWQASANANEIFLVSAPTRSGYVFTGWTISGVNTSTAKWGFSSSPTTPISDESTTIESGTSDVYFKNLTSVDGNVVLIANWGEYSSESDFKYRSLSGGEAVITEYTGSGGYVSVPPTINGRVVVSVGSRCFSSCSKIDSIIIPSGVTNIGSSAFAGCTGLTSITIPPGVVKFGYYCFTGCSRLTSVAIPDSVTKIGFGAFYGCSGLESVTIPAGVNCIEEKVFQGCSGLKALNVDINNMHYVSLGSVLYTKDMTTVVSCPGGLTGEVEILPGVTDILEGAFQDCQYISLVTMPNGVRNIGREAFKGCSKIVSMSIPASVTNISYGAYSGCSSLATVKMPFGVVRVEPCAFVGCRKLVDVSIPSSVESIGSEAFYGCSSLTNVTLQQGVAVIGGGAFQDCKGLVSVVIPSSVTNVGDDAFMRCEGLLKAVIRSRVIGERMFASCSGLTSVEIAPGVTGVGDRAFSACSSLGDVVIPVGVTYIGAYAFSGCRRMTSIEIPKGVTSFGWRAFAACSSLKAVKIPEGVRSLPMKQFESCVSLESVILPSSLSMIGDGAFKNCSALTSVRIPLGMYRIESEAFAGCSSLRSVTIPASVRSIAWHSFYECSRLEKFIVLGGNYVEYEKYIPTKWGCESEISNSKVWVTQEYYQYWKDLWGQGLNVLPVVPYDITYNPGRDGEGVEQHSTKTNEFDIIVAQALFTRTGYRQTGWSTTDGASENDYDLKGLYCTDAAVSLYPVWTPNTYEIVLKPNNGESDIVTNAVYDAEMPMIAVPQKVGHSFAGYFTQDSGGVPYYSADGTGCRMWDRTSATTLYAHWTQNVYKVTFDLGDGSDSSWSTNVTYDAVLPKVTIPMRDGYAFCGYFTEEDGAGKQYYDETGTGLCVWDIAADAVLHAKWVEVAAQTCDLYFYRPSSWPRPMFALSNKTYTTHHSFKRGDTFRVFFAIANFEDYVVTTLPLKLSIRSNGTELRSANISLSVNLGKHVVLSKSLTWTVLSSLPAGNYCLRVTADPNGTLPESCPADNYCDFYFSVVESMETLAGALDCEGFSFETAGLVFPQTNVTYAGASAIQFGPSDPAMTNVLRTKVVGPGSMTCRWAGNSQISMSRMLYLDGTKRTTYTGRSSNWYSMNLTIPAGRHEIAWYSAGTSSSTYGQCVSFLDSIVWTPAEVKISSEITGGKELGVTSEWVVKDLEQRFGGGKAKSFTDKFGDNLLEALVMPTGKVDAHGNPLSVWHDYVAGTDPTDETSKFTSKIEIKDGKPVITWEPALNGEGVKDGVRAYKMHGSNDLQTWTVVSDGQENEYQFFKVSVDMP